MDIQQLNFRHLFYFWQVAKKGNLTQAAHQLHIAQSALSTQIQQLEERLGEALFVRRRRQLVLTGTGQRVLSYAESIFGLGEEMLGWLDGRQDGMWRIRIGSVATMSKNFQANWMRPLIQNPDVLLTVESGQLDDLIASLRQHHLDVVLANEPYPPDQQEAVYSRFLGRQSISLVGPYSVWHGKHLQIPDDLDGLELALPTARHNVRARFDALCFSRGVSPRLRAEIDDMTMLRLIARDSGWLTVLPEVVVQDELENGLLVKLDESNELDERFYAIVTQTRHRLEPLAALLAGREDRTNLLSRRTDR